VAVDNHELVDRLRDTDDLGARQGTEEEDKFLVRQGPTWVGKHSFRGRRHGGVSVDLAVDGGAQRFGDSGPELSCNLLAELLHNPLTGTDQNVWAHSVPPPSVSLALRLARRVPLPEIDRKTIPWGSQKHP
jgi:hypothetical protein